MAQITWACIEIISGDEGNPTISLHATRDEALAKGVRIVEEIYDYPPEHNPGWTVEDDGAARFVGEDEAIVVRPLDLPENERS